MIKSIAFMPRRPDLGRAAFRTYYETRHAPLALKHFRFARYVRNHLSDAQQPGFDCLSEFWHGDMEHTRSLMAGDVGAIMHADEDNFIDRASTRAALAEAYLLSGPERIFEAGTAKTVLLLGATTGANRDMLLASAQQAFSGTEARVTLDLLSPFDTRPLPHDALLTFWSSDDADFAPPPGWSVSGRINVVAEETPAADLARAGQPAV